MYSHSFPPGETFSDPNNVEIVLLDVLLSIVTKPIVAVSAIKTFVVNVPLTSNSVRGVSVLIPIRPLTTSIYNRSVSTAMLTPSLSRFCAKSGPVIRPTAMLAPYTPCFTVNQITLLVYHSMMPLNHSAVLYLSGTK